MRWPRFRLGGAMLLVMVIAVDCGLPRHTLRDPADSMAALIVGMLVAANVLDYGVYRLLNSRESRRPFFVGFVGSGLTAMLALLAYAWPAPATSLEIGVTILIPTIEALDSSIPLSVREPVWLGRPIRVTESTVFLGVPVVAFAAFGGLLCSSVARVAVLARPAKTLPAERSG
jgi:hypothetical protein